MTIELFNSRQIDATVFPSFARPAMALRFRLSVQRSSAFFRARDEWCYVICDAMTFIEDNKQFCFTGVILPYDIQCSS